MCSEVSFPSECIEDIFLHLSGNDLMICNLVCPQWDEVIGSRSFMNKIKLDLQKFTADKSGPFHHRFVELNTPKLRRRKWTRVCAVDAKFESTEQFVEILRTFQSSVVEIKITEGTILGDWGPSSERSDLEFP